VLREHENVVHRVQRLVDVGWIIVAHVVIFAAYGLKWEPRASNATLSAVIVFSVAAELCSIYRGWRVDRFGVELRMTTLAWLMTVATLMTFAFAMKTSAEYSRVATFGWFVLAPALLCGWRVVVRLTLRAMRAHGRNVRNVVIFGATSNARDLCKEIAKRPWFGIRVIGVYDDRGSERRVDLTDISCPFAGSSTDLVNACREKKVDAVYISLPLRAEPRIGKLLQELSNTTATVHLVADFVTFNLLSAHWSAIGEVALISAHDTPFRGVDQLLKRVEDVLVASFIVLIISAPMFVISVIIKLTSPGPIFFRQRRYGLNGEEIRVLKFRSMTVAEDGPQITQATRNDARVTRFGRFLRRTSLDELPQFLQVLTGKMSVVGPRPHAVAHNEAYRSLIRGYMLRHKVKPGITGWAQINGWRGETPEVSSMENRIRFDLEYIRRWTLLWDLKIILLTVFGRKKSRNAF
jgi:putative colanic acid biosysnthesis UDP-glucose lipid carrier transferase